MMKRSKKVLFLWKENAFIYTFAYVKKGNNTNQR